MYNLKKKLVKSTKICGIVLAASCIVSSGLSSLAAEHNVITMNNSDTQKEQSWTGELPFTEGLANGMLKATENESFILYYNPDTLAIQVKEKKTGIIHSSIVTEGDKVEGMNDTWRGMMQSGLTIELRQPNGRIQTWPLSTKGASVTISQITDGFEAKVYWPEGIGITVQVVLTDTGIKVNIPEEGTWEDEDSDYTLQSIYVFPFLDASLGNSQNGYMFVPDGCGALIRTSVPTLSSEAYEKQIYGTDIGLGKFNGSSEQSYLLDPESIYIPVYGIIQNVEESGMTAIIESGEEYANIVAYASGITTDYNFITAKFLVRETYQMKISQGGSSISANQEERNHFDIAVSYHFLSEEDATYIGIAETYRNYLLDNGMLVKKAEAQSDIPLKLEFIVSEQKEALIGTSTVAMTSVEEVDEILTDLMEEGITNLEVVLRGVSKEGATAVSPTVFDFEKETGTKKEWKNLIEKYKQKGIDISFYCDFTKGYEGAGGYSNGDRAQSINKMLLRTFDNGMFTYLAPEFTKQALEDYAVSVNKIGGVSLAVDSLGNSLYSNWNNKSLLTRIEAKHVLEEIEIGEMGLALYAPNSYFFAKADAIYDVSASSSGYYIFTDTIPFLQIVLRGYLPMYGTGFNFHANAETDLLKCVEYGIYPSFYLTKQPTIDLLDTASAWLYTSEYALWKDSILSEYTKMNEVLSNVEGATIINRSVLANDVIQVDYSNGVSIIVNYNEVDYNDGDNKVEAKGYLLVKDRD